MTSQYLLILAYYLTHENSYECHLLMQYGIWHICFNLINQAVRLLLEIRGELLYLRLLITQPV